MWNYVELKLNIMIYLLDITIYVRLKLIRQGKTNNKNNSNIINNKGERKIKET